MPAKNSLTNSDLEQLEAHFVTRHKMAAAANIKSESSFYDGAVYAIHHVQMLANGDRSGLETLAKNAEKFIR